MPPGDLDGGATLYLSQANDEFPRGRRAMILAENARYAIVLEDAADGAIAGARGTGHGLPAARSRAGRVAPGRDP